ncbi:MAG: extensin family protein [Hyphomicrobiales bacterium]|nr:extensin family protein [Hyphomicrobiales bacterium]MBV9052931.1 extensin family protein [Hyphomicrobiales bacterium]MBV9976031.1 extensin family protein [Hyphomicrobiales bacterium]
MSLAAAPQKTPAPPIRPAIPESKSTPAQPSTPSPPTATAPSPPAAQPTPEEAAACLARLSENGVVAESVPAPPTPLPDCSSANPVRMSVIHLASGTTLDLPGKPIVNCAFALVFTDYARNLLAPLAASMLGSPAVSLDTGPAYECRPRNHVAGAKTSAHGKGIAIDLAGIILADHRRIGIAHQADASETLFLHTMRQAACGWFTTVLGPGSDPSHAEHLHFDILQHGSSDHYRICE